MLDPTALPVLLKALDFLFGEGSKIMQERRERRKAQEKPLKPTEVVTTATSSQDRKDSSIRSRDEALKLKITQVAWASSEEQISHLLSLKEIYTRNYHLAKEQYALFGNALVPQVIIHNLNEAENGIESTMNELKVIVEKLYNKELFVSPTNMNC